MGVQYIGERYVDIGEEIHIQVIVKLVCEKEIPFTIRSARFELFNKSGSLEASGDCTITYHTLDALINPQTVGTYTLKFIYNVGDETWVEPVKLRVS